MWQDWKHGQDGYSEGFRLCEFEQIKLAIKTQVSWFPVPHSNSQLLCSGIPTLRSCSSKAPTSFHFRQRVGHPPPLAATEKNMNYKMANLYLEQDRHS